MNPVSAGPGVPPSSVAAPRAPALATPTATPTASPPTDPKSGSVRLLNPDPVIDPALGIVVTEYFNTQGSMTSQYPTQRMLDAYSLNGLPGLPSHPAPEGADATAR